MRVFEVILFLYSTLCVSDANNATTVPQFAVGDIRLGHPGFMLSIPQKLISGKSQLVCLTIHEASPPTRIRIDLKLKEVHAYTDKVIELGYSCFSLNVPSHNKSTPQYVSVRVQIQLDGILYSAHNQDPVLIYPEREHTFIGLDRTFYKPGDKIRMRILIFGHDLLPPEQYRISEIRIRNPLDVSVAVWENISTTAGLVQLEHQIYKDALVGKWRVEVNGETKQFEVSKYVLPRFNINITYPKVIHYGIRALEIKVCSKYNFGQEFRGKAFVKVTDSHGNMKPLYEIQQITNGCSKFSLANDRLNLKAIKRKFLMYDPKILLSITATVIEYGTDKIEVETVKILVDLKEYHMKFVSENTFQPGLPYHGKLQLNNIHIDTSLDVVEICYNVAIRKSWNYLNNEKCSNFTLRNDSSINFNILPLKNSVIHMKLTARSLNYTLIGDSLLVIRVYSSIDDYIVLKPNSIVNKQCGATQQIMVIYTTDRLRNEDNVTFYSVIKSNGQLYSVNKITKKIQSRFLNYKTELKNIIGTPHRYNTGGSSIDKFVLKFNLEEKILSKYQILFYYIASNGETISATREIDRGPCLRNKVQIFWSKPKLYPGAKALLNIKTTSPSLCAISAIDTSVGFMGASDHFSANTLIKHLFSEPPLIQSNRKSCIAQHRKSNPVPSFYTDITDTGEGTRRSKRFIYPFSEDFDAYDTFNKFGSIIITNLKVVTKPCYSGPKISLYNPAPFQTDHYNLQSDDKIISVRTYFPETWIWELTPVRNLKQIQRELPHSVTKWTTNVLCMSPTIGLGVSPTTELSSYQPFFVSIVSPYSIRRGETLHLRVLIFNYMSYSLPIKVTLRNSEGLKLLSDENSASYCILPKDTITHVYPLAGFEMGDTILTVLAEVDPFFPGHCGPESIVNVRDIVIKSIVIEPEGYPVESVKSALLCNEGTLTSSNISWRVHVPSNIVPNTARAKVSLNADLLGHSIENLENLLQIPNGCGEQIMSTMAPNMYILRYLQAIKHLESPVRQRAIKNMKIGYHKIMNFALKDGSFSPFGYHDTYGSMFLTAFVVKTLQLAKQYIFVDQRVIDRAVSWIFSQQLENGCFDAMLHVFQDMGGTTTENSTSALSSYVIISLLDSGVNIPEKIQSNAKYCIRSYSDPDKYTLAISCYALFKIKWYDEANKILRRLLNIASRKNNMLWWTVREENASEATDIEVTSYVLLSLLNYKTGENLAHAHSIVRWLTSKMGSQGGFRSTQDTTVALDALTRYAIIIASKKIDLDIEIQAERQHLNYRIEDSDRLKTKKFNLKSTDNEVNVKVKGEGCLLVQIVTSYYLKNVPRTESFKVALEVTPVSTVAKCSIATMSPCVSYSGPDTQSNMAVLDITLPSGYVADRASLYKLTEKEEDSKVKMFEEIKDRIIFYFTKLDKEVRCFTFGINEDIYVEKRAESRVKLFDYYKPEYESVQLYTLRNCSGLIEDEVTTTDMGTETETETSSTLSLWDYIDTTIYDNETSGALETTTYTMTLEDYI